MDSLGMKMESSTGMYQILAFPDSSQENEWNISDVGNSRLTKGHQQKCGKVPSLATHLHNNDAWEIWGVSIKGTCTSMTEPSQGERGPIGYLMVAQCLKANVRPLIV